MNMDFLRRDCFILIIKGLLKIRIDYRHNLMQRKYFFLNPFLLIH